MTEALTQLWERIWPWKTVLRSDWIELNAAFREQQTYIWEALAQDPHPGVRHE